MPLDRRVIANIDWPLFLLMTTLVCIGLVVLYSAGFDPDTGVSRPMLQQATSFGVGLAAFFFCMFLQTSFWRRWAYLFYAVCCIMLLAILFRGVIAGGAQRWLEVGGVRVQPSEFMKIGVILALARLFSSDRAPRSGYSLVKLLGPFSVLIVPTALILEQPDLGTAMCVLLVGGSMLLLAGVRFRTAMWLAVFGLALAVPGWFCLHDYQRDRIRTFLAPEMDPLGRGYHALQSKIAVGSGAMTGKGFLKGTQTQLRFLPEQTTDFIFSVLAEEWGFVGSIAVLCLYAVLIVHILQISSRCSDAFSAYVSFGVAALIFWHTLINIGMVIGIVPVVGITLVLFSYGGSSLVTVMSALGLVAGFSKRRFVFAS